VSADPDVYLERKLLALGNGDALHENASFGGAAFVELAVDHGECFGSSGIGVLLPWDMVELQTLEFPF